MIPAGAEVAYKKPDGTIGHGRVTASWEGGMLVTQPNPCQSQHCPAKPPPVAVREVNLVIRMATV